MGYTPAEYQKAYRERKKPGYEAFLEMTMMMIIITDDYTIFNQRNDFEEIRNKTSSIVFKVCCIVLSS